MSWGNPPIFSTEIAGIPTGVTKDHNQVLYFWWKAQLECATLFHVDGHHDMSWHWAHYQKFDRRVCLKGYNIGSFIIPAMYEGIVDSVYWLNPHSSERKLQDMGTTSGGEERVKLDVTLNEYRPDNYMVFVTFPFEKSQLFNVMSRGKVLYDVDEVHVPEDKPLILDVDLDAFYCHMHIQNKPVPLPDEFGNTAHYDGKNNYEQRIEETVELLGKLRRPDLITITFSEGEGDGSFDNFVPVGKAEEVYGMFTEGLNWVYG